MTPEQNGSFTTSPKHLSPKFLELRPSQDSIEKAKSLTPLHCRVELGREVFLYEDTEYEKLSEIGEVRPPVIADLFMAIMEKTREGTKS